MVLGIFRVVRQLGTEKPPGPSGAGAARLPLRFQYSHEQGLAKRKLTIEELFHPSTLELVEADV